MYDKDKRSFFERLTGTINVDDDIRDDLTNDELTADIVAEDEEIGDTTLEPTHLAPVEEESPADDEILEDPDEEGELAVDVYEDGDFLIIEAMIAGVNPRDLQIDITPEVLTIRGKREKPKEVSEEDYFHKELYWGAFSRSIVLPEEVDPDSSEALEQHGLLMLKLSKIDKRRTQRLHVKSVA
jgi:HSP20 family protein